MIAALRPHTDKIFDCHLMIEPCDPYLDAFAKAGADVSTIHAEATKHLDRSLQRIRELGKKAGVSLNPATPESAIEYVLDRLDLVLLMTVNSGFGGQAFIPTMADKAARVKRMIGERPILIEIDDGVTPETASLMRRAGADVLVAGSAAFKGGPQAYPRNIAAIRAAACPIWPRPDGRASRRARNRQSARALAPPELDGADPAIVDRQGRGRSRHREERAACRSAFSTGSLN